MFAILHAFQGFQGCIANGFSVHVANNKKTACAGMSAKRPAWEPLAEYVQRGVFQSMVAACLRDQGYIKQSIWHINLLILVIIPLDFTLLLFPKKTAGSGSLTTTGCQHRALAHVQDGKLMCTPSSYYSAMEP
jgi:hypothetical protein